VSTKLRTFAIGFVVGALIPLFWGIVAFVLFNLPEGPASRLFWKAVYVTCPFWIIEGKKALILMPILNGIIYGLLFAAIASLIIEFKKKPGL
jgi:hypothetical protein